MLARLDSPGLRHPSLESQALLSRKERSELRLALGSQRQEEILIASDHLGRAVCIFIVPLQMRGKKNKRVQREKCPLMSCKDQIKKPRKLTGVGGWTAFFSHT